MPTLQAADLNQFDSNIESQAQLGAANAKADSIVQEGWSRTFKRVRGYLALGTLFVVALSGYAALFVLFDRVVAISSGNSG